MIRWLTAAYLAFALFTPGVGVAEPVEPSRPEIAGIRIGFADRYKTGLWTPVEVTLRGVDGLADARLRVIAPDSDGVPHGVTTPLPSFAARGGTAGALDRGTSHDDVLANETKIIAYTRLGRRRGELTVEISSAGEVLAQRTFSTSGVDESGGRPPALFSDQELILTIGPTSVGAEEALGDTSRPRDERPVVARLTDASELPDRWYGYESVRMVIVSTSDLSICSSFEENVERIDALEEWVRMGGKLVFALGSNAEEVIAAGKEASLARFVPGTLREMKSLDSARVFGTYSGNIESYCGSLEPIRRPRSTGRDEDAFRVPLLKDVSGLIESGDGDMPLVVRRTLGFGQIVFLAGDLDRNPMAGWTDRSIFLQKLFDLPTNESENGESGGGIAHVGYTDLTGQLRSALDSFAGVRQVPVSLVIGLIVAYLLIIGPGDYFLLRWLGRRMEWTWVTFPAVVILFCVGAYVLAHRSKGDRLRVNQLDLIDVDVESGRLRGTSWANVFSPVMQRYDIAFEPAGRAENSEGESSVLVSWLGLPGTALGGMDPAVSQASGWREGYDSAPRLDSLLQAPIPIWGTKSVTARWMVEADVRLESNLKSSGQIPVGTVTNVLDFPLENCLLAYGNWAYHLGTLQPDDSADLGPTVQRRELNSLLTGRKQVFDVDDDMAQERVTPYNRESLDVEYILRAMMFFDAAGGQRYTGLSNSYQAFVDLSGILKADRAVLVASVGDELPDGGLSGADLIFSSGDQPLPERQIRHDRVVRFILPVERE